MCCCLCKYPIDVVKCVCSCSELGLHDPTLVRLDVDTKLSDQLKVIFMECVGVVIVNDSHKYVNYANREMSEEKFDVKY